MTTTIPGKLSLFDFHGLDFEPDEAEVKTTCPFCGKANKLHIDVQTGKWDCKSGCGSGNTYTFLAKLLQHAEENAGELDTPFHNHYGFAAETYASWRIYPHPILTDEMVIPAYNAKGNLANLYKIVQVQDRWRAMSSPDCNAHPFGRHLLNDSASVINLFESWSDALQFWESHGEKEPPGILAAPGAGALNQLGPYLDGTFRQPAKVLKQLNIYFDNDEAGAKGVGRLVNKLLPQAKGQPKHVQAVHWSGLEALTNIAQPAKPGQVTKARTLYKPLAEPPENPSLLNPKIPDGFDVRKLLRAMPKTGLSTLGKLLQPVEVASPKEADQPALDPLPCSNFDDLLQYWDQSRGGALHMTQQIQDTLAVVLATVISTPLGGDDQLWFRIIGPPGSAKSTIAEAISAAKPYVWAKSMFTGLHSGYTGGGSGPEEDASHIKAIKNKTICNKDADTLYQQPGFARLMGELRDIYDKTSRFIYRNKKGADHENFACTFILCGTDELRRASTHSHLGERFLDCEIGSDDEIDAVLNVAQDNEYSQLVASIKLPSTDDEPPPSKLIPLKQRTYGFIQHYRTQTNLYAPALPAESRNKLQLYAKLLAYLRAKVQRHGEELEYKPRVERPHRLVKQLTRLAFCLAIVLGKQEIDEGVMRLVRKVVHDTAHGFQYDLFQLLASSNGGLSALQLVRRSTLPETTVRRYLENMQALKMVQRKSEPNRSGQRGRDIHLWSLTPPLQELFEKATSSPKRPASPHSASPKGKHHGRHKTKPISTRKARGNKRRLAK